MAEKENNFEWIEFRTIKDLFSFVISKSIPGQQLLSVIRFRQHTYVLAPMNNSVMIFLTKEEPKSKIYAWDTERDDFVPLARADRNKVNIMVQDVVHDSLISKLFYAGK